MASGTGRRNEGLRAARVLCVGAGGIGSMAALTLARTGVGTIGIADADVVGLTDLHRQVLHRTDDLGRPKVESARDALRRVSPQVRVEMHRQRLGPANVQAILAPYDAVLDGSDNFATRYLLNDACFFAKKPLFWGAVFQYEGQATTFTFASGTPCYRCLYPEPPPSGSVPTCAEAGVFSVVPGVIGHLAAAACAKWLTGEGAVLVGRLVLYDAWADCFDEVRIERRTDCALCGTAPTVHGLIDYEAFCAGG